jgi:hypothetical protein
MPTQADCGLGWGTRLFGLVGVAVVAIYFFAVQAAEDILFEVGGGELESVEHEGCGFVVDGFVVEAVEDLHDADLDGSAVFENGEAIDVVAATSVELLLVEETIGVLAKRRCVAGASVGLDVVT